MGEQASWKVELHDRPNGSSPVVEFVEEQSKRNQAKIFAESEDLAEFGLMLRGDKPSCLEGNAWGFRFREEDLHFRFVYFAHTGRRFVILHGFCKKTRKIPKRELNVARHRLQDYLDRHSQ